MVTGQVRCMCPRPPGEPQALQTPRSLTGISGAQDSARAVSTTVEPVHGLPACLGTRRVGGPPCTVWLERGKRRQNRQAPLVCKQAQPVNTCASAL